MSRPKSFEIMMKLKDVKIYNLKNELVCTNSIGILNQERSEISFNTSLNLSNIETSNLKIGESYYAVGLKEDNLPTRTETLECKVVSNDVIFEGSIKFPKKTKNIKQKGEIKVEAASEADILIEYTNYSSTEFNRSTWGSNLQDGFGGLTNSPGPILKANSGQQSIGASQVLGVLDEGPADIYLCWAQGMNFGVWIHFNFQMFGAGPRPIWYVTTNGSAWELAGSDPSTPYTWNSASVGFNIVGTPTSGHSSLTVGVVITNLKK